MSSSSSVPSSPSPSSSRWTFFIIDTETTGFSNVCVADPRNKTIQLFCRRFEQSGAPAEVFNELMDPGHHIPKESTDFHRITDRDVQGKQETHEVMLRFKEWVEEHTLPGTTPLLVAHNAPFDRTMVYKGLGGEIVGPDGGDMNWVWFDTLEFARKYYASLQRAVWPWEKPFKLEHLLKSLGLGGNIKGAHNAKADVDALQAIFLHVLPTVGDKLEGPEWREQLGVIVANDPKRMTRTRALMDVKGLGAYRCKVLAEEVNAAFQEEEHEVWRRWQTNPHLITLAHLMAFGVLKSQENPTWWNISHAVELLLREKLLVREDHTITDIIAGLCGVSQMDLWEHTMKADGDKRFFPTCWGTPAGFKPFQFTEEQAGEVLRKMKVGTASALYMQYMYSGGEIGRRAWAKKLERITGLGTAQARKTFDDLHRFQVVKKPSSGGRNLPAHGGKKRKWKKKGRE